MVAYNVPANKVPTLVRALADGGTEALRRALSAFQLPSPRGRVASLHSRLPSVPPDWSERLRLTEHELRTIKAPRARATRLAQLAEQADRLEGLAAALRAVLSQQEPAAEPAELYPGLTGPCSPVHSRCWQCWPVCWRRDRRLALRARGTTDRWSTRTHTWTSRTALARRASPALYDRAGVRGGWVFGWPWPLASDAGERHPRRLVPFLAEGYSATLDSHSSYLNPSGLEDLLAGGYVQGLGEIILRHSAFQLGASGGGFAAPATNVAADHPV